MIEIKAKKAHGLSKITGLIGKKSATPLLLTTRFGIHTFFLKFPIDVLVLDESNSVVGFKEGLKPNRVFLWNPKYSTVVELPQGSIKRLKVVLGSEIKLN